MKRTTDSIQKTATAKEKVDHDITVGYQLCNGTKSLYRRSGSQVKELHASCMAPSAPNSAKFKGGCRGPAKIRQRGVAIFFYFLRVKNITF